MSLKLKLIAETPYDLEDFEIIEEQSNLKGQSNLYVAGPMIGCGSKNKNGRLYEKNSTRTEVNRYIEEMVKTGRAMGELNHPSSADVNLERACHLVTELKEIDDGFYGKAKVLSTPCGQILRALINDGVRIGMSTRALGSLKEQSDYNLVENMHLVAIDTVADPSHSTAFVNGILESKSWIVEQDGRYEESYDNFEKAISKIPRKEADSYLRQQIVRFINNLH
jgi:hypothetical protein